MKRFLSMALGIVLLLGCFGLTASAEETIYPKVSHSYTTTEDFASDDWSVDQRGAYLGTGVCTIARKDSTHVSISGSTNGTQTCDTVQLTLYLERSKEYAKGYGCYKDYAFTGTNVYRLAKEISNIPIDRGYYYRVKAVHSVVKNGVRETTDSVTNPIDYR